MSSGSVTLPTTGGSGGGVTSINGDTTAAQLIVGGTGISVATAGGTTTITNTGAGSGTVTSVDVSGGTTGLTTSGGPVTTSGVITIAGTLAVGSGGTNSTAALNNNRVMISSGGAIVEEAAITASRALASDTNGLPVASATTATELGFVSGVTSSIQTQLNGKQATGNYITSLTSDVTATGPGAATATIAINAVTNSKLAQMAAHTYKGNNTGSTANPIDVTSTQLTADLNQFTSSLQGMVPGSGGGSANFLRADGSWTPPAGTAGITSLTGDVTATGPGASASTIAVGAVTDAKGSLAVKPAVTVVATTNQALSGTPTIDGQATAAGSVILLTAQSTGSQNGPWVAAAGAWSRPNWYVSGNTTQAFQFITTFVRLGTTYQGTTWRQTAAAPITIDTTATTWSETPLALNSTSVTGTLPVANVSSNLTVSNAGIVIDGGGSVITTGSKGYIQVNFNATIASWTVLANASGSITMDVKRSTYAGFPTTTSIIGGGNAPLLSSAQNNTATPSGWTSTTITSGDVLEFSVSSATTVTRVTVQLTLTRT